MANYPVVLIDDEVPFINSLGRALEEEGYSVTRLRSISEAVSHLSVRLRMPEDGTADDLDAGWFILVLDHDFPPEDPTTLVAGLEGEFEVRNGYGIARWLRIHHSLGRMLPIIYLSGRESAQGFIAQMRENGQYHPDDFITKAEIGANVEMLLDRISHFDSELNRLYAMVEEHGEKMGRYLFFDLFND